MASDIDHREDLIPESLRRQQALAERLLNPSAPGATPQPSAALLPVDTFPAALQLSAARSPGIEVEITHELAGTFRLEVMDVAVGDDGIALLVDKRSTSFTPKAEQRYKVAWDKQERDVVYLGGSFQFRSWPARVICFLTEGEEK